MHIRAAKSPDRTAILALMRPRDPNRLRLDPTRFLVAEADDRIVGIVQVKRHWDGTPELASLVVDEAHRGQGIGSALVRNLVQQHGNAHPAETLYLFCLAQLEGYYNRLGFHTAPRKQLPWSLAILHLLGNGLGRLLRLTGNARIQIIAMNHKSL